MRVHHLGETAASVDGVKPERANTFVKRHFHRNTGGKLTHLAGVRIRKESCQISFIQWPEQLLNGTCSTTTAISYWRFRLGFGSRFCEFFYKGIAHFVSSS
jgi:hypothetical protein